MRKYVTLVGSRDGITQEITDLQMRLGGTLCDLGYTGRSGLAPFSDQNFYYGALLSPNFLLTGFDNFIPGRWFFPVNHSPRDGFYHLSRSSFQLRSAALGIGARGGDRGIEQRRKPGAYALHSRNPMQLLGESLDTLSKFLICHAKPVGKAGKVSGGTNTAVALALHFKLDVINTYTDEGRKRAELFLATHEKFNYADIFKSTQRLVDQHQQLVGTKATVGRASPSSYGA